MNIGLHDPDNTNYPNLALMKISAWHKSKGHTVSFFNACCDYDYIYSSKVFTWTTDFYLPQEAMKGGIGYRSFVPLANSIEHICPDYSLYGIDYSMGFLTRGCPNKCSWCIVPEKEGDIKSHADIKEFAQHKKVVLMDNNVLACDHGIQQIEKIAKLGLKVDFNQGLDARLIDDGIAKRLSNVKWLHPVRLACDSDAQMEAVFKAVTLLRWHNTRPLRYFVYVMVNDLECALERVKFLKGLYCEPFAQPYRDFENKVIPTQEQKHFSRWVNHTACFNSVEWKDYNKI